MEIQHVTDCAIGGCLTLQISKYIFIKLKYPKVLLSGKEENVLDQKSGRQKNWRNWESWNKENLDKFSKFAALLA